MKNRPDQSQVQVRLQRLRYQIMEPEFSQETFYKTLEGTRFSELWHDFSTHVYQARCALQKPQREADESTDKQWFEE